MATSASTSPRPGRPRSERARLAILRATADLLVERGPRGMSMDEVARTAGVSKATIYRWWGSKQSLELEAFLVVVLEPEGPTPDTGSLRGDLIRRMRSSVRFRSTTPAGRVMALLVGEAQRDPELAAAFRRQVIGPLRDRSRVILDRARERGEVGPSVDADVVLDMLYGALYHRLLLGHGPLDDAFAESLVDTVLAGLLPRPEPE